MHQLYISRVLWTSSAWWSSSASPSSIRRKHRTEATTSRYFRGRWIQRWRNLQPSTVATSSIRCATFHCCRGGSHWTVSMIVTSVFFSFVVTDFSAQEPVVPDESRWSLSPEGRRRSLQRHSSLLCVCFLSMEWEFACDHHKGFEKKMKRSKQKNILSFNKKERKKKQELLWETVFPFLYISLLSKTLSFFQFSYYDILFLLRFPHLWLNWQFLGKLDSFYQK